MAELSDAEELKRLNPPKSPTECNFSQVFCERNRTEENSLVQWNGEETQQIDKTGFTEKKTESTMQELTADSDRNAQGDGNLACGLQGELVLEEDNLIDAIKQDRLDAIKKLLHDGCNPNEPVDAEGNRPLHWAVFAQNGEYVQLLLEAGADVNLPGKNGATPLMVAPSLYRHQNAPWHIVHNLIKANCDINRVTTSSKSVLHLAVQLGNVELVHLLLQCSATNIDIQDAKQRSPIMYAVLLSCADIWQFTSDYTLHDVEEIAYLLIKANVNVSHNDKFRQNALHFAIPNIDLYDRSRGQQISFRIVRMLEIAGGKIPPKRLLRPWSSVSKEKSKPVQDVILWFEKQRTAVKPLQHWCRLAIRKRIGQQIQQKLGTVGLPEKLKDYLLLPELDDILRSEMKPEVRCGTRYVKIREK